MQQRTVDVAIIGAGTAGLTAYKGALDHTDNVVLIEGGPYGTTCARVGCMPSKLLIAAAEAAYHVETAAQFGVHADNISIDGAAVMQRVQRERDRFVASVLKSVDAIDSAHKLCGYARFLDNQRLQVDDHTVVTAKAIVIATGSTPRYPQSFKTLGQRLITSDEIFGWDDLPNAVAVFGAGAIGLELAQALRRLGVRVFVFGKGGNVGSLTDPAVMDVCRQTLQDEFYVDPDANVTSMKVDGEQVIIDFTDTKGQARTEAFDYVLAATGRTPNVTHLDLQNTDFELAENGVPLFNPYTLQVGDSPVFIAGDANILQPVLHEAADQGRTAGDNAGRYPDIRIGLRRAALSIVFCDPQIAIVGRRYSELEGDCFAIGEVSFADQGRSRVMGINRGLLRVYAEPGTGLLLGAEMCGPQAEHLGHLLAWACQQRLDVGAMLDLPFYHPVVEEGLRTALKDARRKLRLGLSPMPYPLDCGPGV
jgi:dihydrolipoamide dehydrogenase